MKFRVRFLPFELSPIGKIRSVPFWEGADHLENVPDIHPAVYVNKPGLMALVPRVIVLPGNRTTPFVIVRL